ncbi:MAG: hypothetical protein JST00_33635 [Deltaproteobacteria bacterium]|nr:hypothetical protein [Deltaproteobacteria bacterium]
MTANRADGTGSHPLDIWHVRLDDGETRTLSLDELDRAYDEGWIHERTLVLEAGAIHWVPLAEIAGLDTAVVPEPPVHEPAPYSIAPLALDTSSAPENRFDALGADEALAALRDDPDATFLTRKRRWPKVMRVASILAVIGVVGVVGFQKRPQIADALATATGKKAALAAQAAAAQAQADVESKAKARAEAETKAKAEAEAKAKARAEAEAKAKAEAEAKAKAEAEVPTMSLSALPNAKKGVRPLPAKKR